MGKLSCKIIREQPNLSGFSCGKDRIDEHISEAWQIVLMRRSVVYEILVDGKQVGFLSYYIKNYPDTEIDLDEEEYQCSFEKYMNRYFCSAHIEYIAVREEYQNCTIGTRAMQWFIKYVQTYLPVRYITLDSTADNVSWYKRFGFSSQGSGDAGNTIMHKDLRNIEELERISEQME